MRITLLAVIIGSLFISSCSKKEAPEPLLPKVMSVNGHYLIDKEEHRLRPVVGGTAHFDYDGERVTKRRGGYITISSAGGPSGFYTTDIYDTLQYHSANRITITTRERIKDVDIFSTDFKREITLENGLVARKITYDESTPHQYSDTIYYHYDSQKKLKKTVQYYRWNIITKEYLFDSMGNLQKIEGTARYRDDNSISYTTEEQFGGYDDKTNPLKGLGMWQDLFYRTLSTNNFTTYTFKRGSNIEGLSWVLQYDAEGNVDFSI
ncbi:hypothetical protein [Pontibacter amylolyticus]|nr:hypothetical protein [Pontibacter amylolyticus]